MVGFENFQVSAWLDGGLTKQPEHSRTVAPRPLRKSAWKTVVAAAFFTSVAVTAEANVGIPQTTTSLRVDAGAQSAGASVSNDAVPIGYWPKLLHEIRGWNNLEEQAAEPPEPIV